MSIEKFLIQLDQPNLFEFYVVYPRDHNLIVKLNRGSGTMTVPFGFLLNFVIHRQGFGIIIKNYQMEINWTFRGLFSWIF